MEFLFHRVYEMADHVSTMTNVYPSFEELSWDSPEVSGCLHRFSKASVLGHFCFTHIRLQDLTTARKDPENFDIGDLEAALERYAIPFVSFQEFMKHHHPDEQEHTYIELEHLHSWMVSQEDEAFAALWERMAEEVFHLLFGNRGFLLEFNLQLAAFRKERGDTPSRRCSIPQWVKRAVYFRENGKCAFCKKDLSGLIAVDPMQHYDHIVPLKALGANDPCNIQLLCARCNLEKAASQARTSAIYDPWWT
jgi:HNH endonuclease